MLHFRILALSLLAFIPALKAQETKLYPIGPGWAQNSVNTTIFRKNSVTSDHTHQYAAYYDANGHVVIAKRRLDTEDWTVKQTAFTGNIQDAHNSISIAIDGQGILHLSWDHHNNSLRYARSKSPDSLEFTPIIPMVGDRESDVTYPEFHSIVNGDLLFLYRDGESGRGNLIINRYQVATQKWTRVQTKLLDGENQRNAYWQAHTDPDSETIYLSWTWRETWDVSTNHDICYAASHDGGQTWQKSSGEQYPLPITATTAEYAARIPQNSELINQTSMCADANGHPYIASYWTPAQSDTPQFHIAYHDGQSWHTSQITRRQTPFSLSGGGTKRIPISRPQILADSTGPTTKAYLIFRDVERQNRPSIATCPDLAKPTWQITDLAELDLGQWEPSYDIPLWHSQKQLALFIQKTAQGDAETTQQLPPQQVSILQYTP
ncbi:hypothetical protein VDG1235_271 [Verrucomicrobiia bacterium DG1235]|nr:hypothetical protein VDG1235_271 [Verrucomicrobiae bacterium DG1235]